MSQDQRQEIVKTLCVRSFSEQHAEEVVSAITKTGDAGMTHLMFEREVPKWHPRIKVLGTLDTMNSFLNLSKAGIEETQKHALNRVQESLVYVMGEIATHEDDVKKFYEFYHSLTDSDVVVVEALTKRLEAEGPRFAAWVEDLSLHRSFADVARTFVRQAESASWEMVSQNKLRPLISQWLNRLADFLWALSRIQHTQ